jgi:hypothetical protein
MIWSNRYKDTITRRQQLESWHPWYAWYPVRLDDGRLAWFEWVLRKQCYEWGYYHGVGAYEPYWRYKVEGK